MPYQGLQVSCQVNFVSTHASDSSASKWSSNGCFKSIRIFISHQSSTSITALQANQFTHARLTPAESLVSRKTTAYCKKTDLSPSTLACFWPSGISCQKCFVSGNAPNTLLKTYPEHRECVCVATSPRTRLTPTPAGLSRSHINKLHHALITIPTSSGMPHQNSPLAVYVAEQLKEKRARH
jgi:hypothetical protein